MCKYLHNTALDELIREVETVIPAPGVEARTTRLVVVRVEVHSEFVLALSVDTACRSLEVLYTISRLTWKEYKTLSYLVLLNGATRDENHRLGLAKLTHVDLERHHDDELCSLNCGVAGYRGS
jgi:hypothetical protein